MQTDNLNKPNEIKPLDTLENTDKAPKRNARRAIEDLLEAKRLRAELEEYDALSDSPNNHSYEDLMKELYS